MNDRIFVDTNLFVYSIANEPQKRSIAEKVLLAHEVIVSSQVMSEFLSVTMRKQILPAHQAITYAKQFMQVFEVTAITQQTVILACEMMMKYQFSYWDSLIVAAALESRCLWLYTEDLQDGQQIEATLTIYNPFQHP